MNNFVHFIIFHFLKQFFPPPACDPQLMPTFPESRGQRFNAPSTGEGLFILFSEIIDLIQKYKLYKLILFWIVCMFFFTKKNSADKFHELLFELRIYYVNASSFGIYAMSSRFLISVGFARSELYLQSACTLDFSVSC